MIQYQIAHPKLRSYTRTYKWVVVYPERSHKITLLDPESFALFIDLIVYKIYILSQKCTVNTEKGFSTWIRQMIFASQVLFFFFFKFILFHWLHGEREIIYVQIFITKHSVITCNSVVFVCIDQWFVMTMMKFTPQNDKNCKWLSNQNG